MGRAFTFLSALCLLIFIVSTVFDVLSYCRPRYHVSAFWSDNGTELHVKATFFGWDDGTFTLTTEDMRWANDSAPVPKRFRRNLRAASPPDTQITHWTRRSPDQFIYSPFSSHGSTDTWHGRWYENFASLSSVMTVNAILPTLWLFFRVVRWLRARRQEKLGLCPICNYDLRASNDRCPECGTPIAIAN